MPVVAAHDAAVVALTSDRDSRPRLSHGLSAGRRPAQALTGRLERVPSPGAYHWQAEASATGKLNHSASGSDGDETMMIMLNDNLVSHHDSTTRTRNRNLKSVTCKVTPLPAAPQLRCCDPALSLTRVGATQAPPDNDTHFRTLHLTKHGTENAEQNIQLLQAWGLRSEPAQPPFRCPEHAHPLPPPRRH